MRQAEDTKTADLLPGHDFAGERPVMPSASSLRTARYRAAHGLLPMTVNIPASVKADFDAWLTAKGKGRSEVIAKRIQTQLLRKR